jgi:hypothetical protein
MSQAKFETTEVPVSALLLDPENPRFYDLKALQGRKDLTQEELMREMEDDDQIPTLAKAIRRSGVTDPIWLKDLGNGKYLVLEGNRRTYILRQLLAEKQKPPSGVRYDLVRANVYPPGAPETELLLQRVRLQAGKKEWGSFNEAVLIYELRFKHKMEEEDIAVELQKSMKEVRHRIESFKMFKEYSESTKDINPKRFAMFHDAPPRVWNWINESDRNLKTYYTLVSPTDGKQKIRSVATRGGLRDFAQVLDDHEALEAVTKDPDTTVEDALQIVKENNLVKDVPFVQRIGAMATHLMSLTDSQIEKLKGEKKYQTDLKRLKKACETVLDKIGAREES